MKNVLVIGGSVFSGRVFSIRASKSKEFNLHVVNRGNFPMELDGVTQYKCDRHSPRMIARLVPNIKYDALVDFCGYSPGEIRPMIEALKGRINHYIFFSTARVYADTNGFADESTPLTDKATHVDDLVSELVNNKIRLEQELKESCAEFGINYTILRPAMMYGPYNNAARESYFVRLIARNEPVPDPIDATGYFNFVYVMDVADAVMTCIGNEKAYNQIFNLAGEEPLTYPQFISVLECCSSEPFEVREVTVSQAYEESIPLSFPLTENILIDGKKFANTFSFSYTPFYDGFKETFDIFLSLYSSA